MSPAAKVTSVVDTLASPCVNVCRMSPVTGYCEGCGRSICEIAAWSAYSDREKRAVLARLPDRTTRL